MQLLFFVEGIIIRKKIDLVYSLIAHDIAGADSKPSEKEPVIAFFVYILHDTGSYDS